MVKPPSPAISGASSSRITRLVPMNPALPVTRMVLCIELLDKRLLDKRPDNRSHNLIPDMEQPALRPVQIRMGGPGAENTERMAEIVHGPFPLERGNRPVPHPALRIPLPHLPQQRLKLLLPHQIRRIQMDVVRRNAILKGLLFCHSIIRPPWPGQRVLVGVSARMRATDSAARALSPPGRFVMTFSPGI